MEQYIFIHARIVLIAELLYFIGIKLILFAFCVMMDQWLVLLRCTRVLNIVSIYTETLLLVIMITCYQVFVFVLDSLSANQTSPRDVCAWGVLPYITYTGYVPPNGVMILKLLI